MLPDYTRPMGRFARGFLLVIAVLVAGACGGSGSGDEQGAGRARITDLTSVDQLREAFEADEGVARLVLLLSPT